MLSCTGYQTSLKSVEIVLGVGKTNFFGHITSLSSPMRNFLFFSLFWSQGSMFLYVYTTFELFFFCAYRMCNYFYN